MNYGTIQHIQRIMRQAGLTEAIKAARMYGVTEPGEFVLYFVALPGQRVRIRK